MKKFHGFLNTDALFEVLSRLTVKALLGMKSTSTEWYKLISSPSFIKAQLEKKGLVLSGFIFQEKYLLANEDIKTISYINIPPLDHHHPNTRSEALVNQKILSFLPEDVVVLASCNGLICCRSCFLFSTANPTLYICNPTNREWTSLACLNYCRSDRIALAVDHNYTDIPAKFNLIRVKQVKNTNEEEEEEDEEQYLTFEIYSSETKLWKKSDEVCRCDNNLIKNNGVYAAGVLHWLTDGDEILTFDFKNELSCLISVPIPSSEFRTKPEACIGESKGILHYVIVSEMGLQVWCLQDYYDVQWELKFSKSLEEIERENPNFFLNLKNRVLQRVVDDSPWMNPMGFQDGVLLIKVCVNLYLYDIEKDKVVQACNLQDLSSNYTPCPTVLAYSLSLVPLNKA